MAWTQLAGLLEIIDEGLISHNQAADVLEELYKSDFSARQIVQKKGWQVVADPDQLREIVEKVLADNPPQAVARYRQGGGQTARFLRGGR